jgi:hypothetical protein
MNSLNWFTSMFSGSSSEGDTVSASTFNVTKIVSIFVAFFAGITQGLTSAGVVGLSTTQMVTIWLVAAGLVVLLSITDMVCRAYVTAKMYGFGEASVAGLHPAVHVKAKGEKGHQDAELLGILTSGSGQLAHVHWTDENGKDSKDAYVPFDEISLHE